MRTSLLAVAMVVALTGATSAKVQPAPTQELAGKPAVTRTRVPVGKRVLGRHVVLVTQDDAHRARLLELARLRLRPGQPDVVIIDGLLPPLPGVLVVPEAHPDAQSWPVGMVITVAPRRTYWTPAPPCMRCSHELARCSAPAAPMWPWITALAVLAGGALLLVARECRPALLEPPP
ncbi:MAG: hypothetical protein H0T79_23935 [Deltaproteobacteria bacterium]|nr:hypothetical protein [Deltaproteobacteria bacterium]